MIVRLRQASTTALHIAHGLDRIGRMMKVLLRRPRLHRRISQIGVLMHHQLRR